MPSDPKTDDASVLAKLERLTKLKDQGTLNDDEFQNLKRNILGEEISKTEEVDQKMEIEDTKDMIVDSTATPPQAPDTVPTSSKAKPVPIQEFRTVSWFLGGCFFILGCSYILRDEINSEYYSMIMFIIAGLLLPPIRDWVYGITSVYIPTWVRTLFIFGLIMYWSVLSVQTDTQTLASQQQEEERMTSEPVIASIPEEQQASSDVQKQEEQATTSGTRLVLGYTIEEFVERYNQASKAMEVDVRYSVKQESDNGKALTVQLEATLHENMAMILTADNKTREVQSLAFIGSGDGTAESGIYILFGILATVMAIENPLMPVDEREKIIKDFDISRLSAERKIEITRDNVEYTLSQYESFGTMLVAAPKDS